MAKIMGHKSAVFFNLVSLLFFIPVVSVVENRVVGTVPKANPSLVCNKVVGMKSEDSCFAIAQQFKLTTDAFHFINPNLHCDALFIDQWICIDGKLT